MTKKFTRILCFIICGALISLLPLSVFALSDADGGEENEVYYCREALGTLPNAEALLNAYDAIVAGVEQSLDSILIFDGTHRLSVEEIDVVYDAYIRDHTEHFWLGKHYSFSFSEGENAVLAVNNTYTLSGEALSDAKLAFAQSVDSYLSNINGSMSDYEKELILHDALAARVVYRESEHAHDSYGALVEGVAVCEALQCLLHAAGIRSMIAIGSSTNPTTNLPEGHAWNIVRIDGKYYHTDLTWNDQASNLFHAYFNVTEDEIKRDHTVFDTVYPLPVCDSLEQNYFVKNNSYLEEYSVDSIAQRLESDNLLTSVYIKGDLSSFVTWFGENIRSIADVIGITDAFSYAYLTLGNEIVLKIDSCLHKNLTFVQEVKVGCENDGNAAHYVCECGRYFHDVDAAQAVLSPEILFFKALDHHFVDSDELDAALRSTPEDCRSVYTYWKVCSRCDAVSDTEYTESERHGAHTPGDAATEENPQICLVCSEILAPKLHTHSLVLVEAAEPNCTKDGKEAYYRCECGKYFEDSDATREISDLRGFGNLDKLGHAETDSKGRCTRCGTWIKPINRFTLTVAGGVLAAVIVIRILAAFIEKLIRKAKK